MAAVPAKIPPEIQRLAAEQTQELSTVDAAHVSDMHCQAPFNTC